MSMQSQQQPAGGQGRLNGKVAVITGGSTGIGLATAQRFVQEGAQVFITGRRQAELDKAVSLIGGHVTAVQGDVGSLADLDRLYLTVKQQAGRLDVLVANAGIGMFQPVDTVTEDQFDKQFNTNVKGLFFSVQKALPLMGQGASIVLIASVVATKGYPATSVYSATKAAVRNFARTLTADLQTRGIRVNVVSPGPVDTPIFDTMGLSPAEIDALKAGFATTVPMGRMGRPEEIANPVLFLASEESSYITGVELFADGGSAQV